MQREEPRTISRRARSTHDFQEIILDKRAEAMEVLEQLYGLLEQYKVATVADLYSLVGIEDTFADQKFGWTELRGSKVVQIRGGYLIDLPQPEPID